MTERKVLNKYYPIDYDPSKIPKLKGKQKEQNRLWSIRVMAPFNMRCNTCGEYIYKGKKFNSKKETVDTEDYLGIQIHRFYIRCPKCVAVIAFKTDPENSDYALEAGATRNFEAAKTLQELEKKKQKELEDEEAANPMKVLENRTKQSKNEMDTMEALTELRELNARHEKVDYEDVIKKAQQKAQLVKEEMERLQQAEEDRLIQELFGSSEQSADNIRRIDDDDDEEDWTLPPNKMIRTEKPTDLLTDSSSASSQNGESSKTSAVSTSTTNSATLSHKKPQSTKALLTGLVKIKKSSTTITAIKQPQTTASDQLTNSNTEKSETSKADTTTQPPAAAGALSMLGGYSSSETDSD